MDAIQQHGMGVNLNVVARDNGLVWQIDQHLPEIDSLNILFHKVNAWTVCTWNCFPSVGERNLVTNQNKDRD